LIELIQPPLGSVRKINKKSERKQNLALVIDTLRRHGALTQAQLKNHCHLQASTVSYLVRDLKARSLVEVSGLEQQDGRVGKPGSIIQLNNGRAQFLGVYVDDDMLHAYRIGLDGATLECDEVQFGDASVEQSVIGAIGARLAGNPQIMGIGVTIKAIVYNDGRIKSGTRHRQGRADESWDFSGLSDTLRDAIPGIPVLVENDANSAAELYHYENRLKNGSVVVYLLNKTPFGIGCGIMINGVIYRGARGAAGEYFEKDSKVRGISAVIHDEDDFVGRFIPAILPHIQQTAYLLDPQLIVLSGSYLENLRPESVAAVSAMTANVPAPVALATGEGQLNPAKGVALLATNHFINRFVEEVSRQ
jgi:hypothetical protein